MNYKPTCGKKDKNKIEQTLTCFLIVVMWVGLIYYSLCTLTILWLPFSWYSLNFCLVWHLVCHFRSGWNDHLYWTPYYLVLKSQLVNFTSMHFAVPSFLLRWIKPNFHLNFLHMYTCMVLSFTPWNSLTQIINVTIFITCIRQCIHRGFFPTC